MDEHQHCQSCIKSYCTECPHCPTESCSNGCGFSLHGCKWVEHNEHTCQEALVVCTNASFGCKEKLPRRLLGRHIEHCPASILQCRFCYYRCKREGMKPVLSGNLNDEKLLRTDYDLYREAACYKKDGNVSPSLDIIVENCPHTSLMRITSCTYPKGRTRWFKLSNDHPPTFHCNEIIRRDEYSSHWKNIHLDIQLDFRECIRRCPLQIYGCMHGQKNLVPHPLGSHIDYNNDRDLFSFVPATMCTESDTSDVHPMQSEYLTRIQKKRELALFGYGDEEESYDALSQLPMEILLCILCCLDSLSLWNLSQVNHYIRRMCFYRVKKQGIVYCRYVKNTELCYRWICSPKVRY